MTFSWNSKKIIMVMFNLSIIPLLIGFDIVKQWADDAW